MGIKIHKYNNSEIESTRDNNKTNSEISFQNYLDNAKKYTTTLDNPKTYTAINVTEQTLANVKKVYDDYLNQTNSETSSISFNNYLNNIRKNKSNINSTEETAIKESEDLYNDYRRVHFPPLNAPDSVKEAWNKLKESISKTDIKTQQEFEFKTLILDFEANNPEEFGLPADFKLNTIGDYETLVNNDIAINETISKIFKNNDEYKSFIKIDQNFMSQLKEELLKN